MTLPNRVRAVLIALFTLGLLPDAATALEVPWSIPDAGRLKAAARDAAVESLPGNYFLLLPEPFAAPIPLREARYNWRFSRAVYLYAPVRKNSGHNALQGGLKLLTILHHEPEDTKIAQQTARLIARLLRLHYEHFGREVTFPRDADAADVWLAPEAPPNAPGMAGETRDNQVYLFAVREPRSPIEWTRTVAHEWGHLTMNAARGFLQPENDAGGFLGERLYLKWLWEEKIPAVQSDDGVVREGLNLYYERQIRPLIARFNQIGPAPKTLNSLRAESMDLYIGGVLASDTADGSLLTGRALRHIEGVRPGDFFVSLREERRIANSQNRARQKPRKS